MAKAPNIPIDALTLSPQAMDFLGLKQQPFSSSILSSDAIYSDATLEQLKDTIKHHLQFSELILVAEGDIGSGKTTLFRQLIQSEIPNLFLMPVHAEAVDTFIQIQQKMSIHLKDQGEANYLDDNLKNLQMFDQTPVLLIDDAHVLSDTTLQELIRYRQQLFVEKNVQLKLLFLANKGMAETIEHISDIQHKQLSIQLIPAFTPKQINAYIKHKLLISGSQQTSLLDEEKIQQIYKKSNGNPTQAMQQAVITLEKLTKKQASSLKLPGKPVVFFALLVLLSVLAIAAYFYFSAGNVSEQTVAVTNAPAPLAIEEQEPVEQQLFIDQSTDQTSAPMSPADNNIEENAAREPATELNESNLVDKQQTLLIDDITETAAPSTTEDVIDTPPLMMETNINPPKAPASSATTIEPVEETAQPAALNAPIVEKPATPPAKPPIIQQPQAKPVPTNAALSQLAQLGIKDKNWLNQQNPKHFTLQILGARDPATLVKFVKQHGIKADTAWYVTDLKGKPWYVLVHRFYTNQDIARQSLARLPKGLQQANPWVKSVASIHKVTR